MCLPFDEIKGYLYYYALRFQNSRFQRDELVNEAWIAIHGLDVIEFASQGIRWAMQSYMRHQQMQDHRGKVGSKIQSIDEELVQDLFMKNMLIAPQDRRKQVWEDKEYVHYLLRNGNLTFAERLLLDQRYYQGLTLTKMGKIHNCSYETIANRLKVIMNKLRKLTEAA